MNKNRKLIMIALSILMLTLVLSACSNATSEAQKSFEGIMQGFKSCDEDTIDEVYGFTEVSNYIDKTSGEALKEAVISTLAVMDYKVNSVEKISNTAVHLNVDISTVDFSVIVQKYIDEVIALVDSREYKARVSSMEDAEYEKIMTDKMIEIIKEERDTRSTKTVDVTMTKSGDEWTFGGDSEMFLEALFAGLSTAVESIM